MSGVAESLAPDSSRSRVVIHAGNVREQVTPTPGEVWLQDGDERPVIVTGLTWDRGTWIQPQPDAPGYRESYCGAECFYADEWTRLWPPDGRRS
jgi:hypothetical protein